MIVCYPFLFHYTVPSAPPQHLTGVAESSTVISLSWFPPPSIDINGNLEYYLVTVAETETGQHWTFHAVKPDIIIGSLHPHYHYYCRVSAYTVGLGPLSAAVDVQTEEEGKEVNFFS